jgi:hypothetical protein
MEAALKGQPAQEFGIPPGVKFVQVCQSTGLLPDKGCARTVTEVFASDRVPTATAGGQRVQAAPPTSTPRLQPTTAPRLQPTEAPQRLQPTPTPRLQPTTKPSNQQGDSGGLKGNGGDNGRGNGNGRN